MAGPAPVPRGSLATGTGWVRSWELGQPSSASRSRRTGHPGLSPARLECAFTGIWDCRGGLEGSDSPWIALNPTLTQPPGPGPAHPRQGSRDPECGRVGWQPASRPHRAPGDMHPPEGLSLLPWAAWLLPEPLSWSRAAHPGPCPPQDGMRGLCPRLRTEQGQSRQLLQRSGEAVLALS